jgi:hypothetical protein
MASNEYASRSYPMTLRSRSMRSRYRVRLAGVCLKVAPVRYCHDLWLFGTAQFFRHQRSRGWRMEAQRQQGLPWQNAFYQLFVLHWQNRHDGFVSPSQNISYQFVLPWQNMRYGHVWVFALAWIGLGGCTANNFCLGKISSTSSFSFGETSRQHFFGNGTLF